NTTVIQVTVLLLVLGGCFAVLEASGGLLALVRVLIFKFSNHKRIVVWLITLLMMLLSSLFGLQEELLILFPICLVFARAMKWSKFTALSLILVTTGVGFTTALFNPFTVGIASELAGISVIDGIWFRLVIFILLYILTSLFLVWRTKRDESKGLCEVVESEDELDSTKLSVEEQASDKKKATMTLVLFGVVFGILIISVAVPFLEKLGLSMIFMGVAFITGTFILGSKMLGSFKLMIGNFWIGAKAISPAIIITLMAFSVKYIAESGNILHTIFYYVYGFMITQSPYVCVILIYVFVLLIEFFIPGSTSKALLLVPLLTLTPIPGISKVVIVLAYLFGDGYANVLYPTCGTLVVGLSLAKVSYIEWLKKVLPFQLGLFLFSCATLCVAVAIGI
ncbi:MAG: hypothetical protein RR086_03640, partial [Clostridia bacterium]